LSPSKRAIDQDFATIPPPRSSRKTPRAFVQHFAVGLPANIVMNGGLLYQLTRLSHIICVNWLVMDDKAPSSGQSSVPLDTINELSQDGHKIFYTN